MGPRGPRRRLALRRTDQPSALLRPRWGVGLCVLLAVGACLNPMPDDYPSERDNTPSASAGTGGSNGTGAAAGGGAGTGTGLSGGTGGASSASGGSGGSGGGSAGSTPGVDDNDNPDAGAPPPGDAGAEVGDGGT